MGGLVACHLAARYPTAGTVLLAPALKLRNQYRYRLAGVAQYPLPWLYPLWRADLSNAQIQAQVREFLPDADFSDLLAIKQLRQDMRIPTGALYELIRLQQVIRRNLWRLRMPLLVLHGRLDRTVLASAAEIAIAEASSADKTLAWFGQSGHMLPNDVEREVVWSTTADWIARVTG
jgi:esterase/lipase